MGPIEDLAELIQMLRENGVLRYRYGNLELEISPQREEFTPERVVNMAPEEKEPTPMGYKHPSLWPGGKPPSFEE